MPFEDEKCTSNLHKSGLSSVFGHVKLSYGIEKKRTGPTNTPHTYMCTNYDWELNSNLVDINRDQGQENDRDGHVLIYLLFAMCIRSLFCLDIYIWSQFAGLIPSAVVLAHHA